MLSGGLSQCASLTRKTRRGSNRVGLVIAVCHFPIAPPGAVALPRFSADPAVLAPCVLESFDEGIVLCAAGPVVPFFIGIPPPEVVPPFIESPVVVLLA